MAWSRINSRRTEQTEGTASKTDAGVRSSGHEQAHEAVAKSEKVVELLERAFELMAEDDPIQPAIKHLYVALHEAEVRFAVLEDWYWRTYVLEDRIALGGHDDQERATVRKEEEQPMPERTEDAAVGEIKKSVRDS